MRAQRPGRVLDPTPRANGYSPFVGHLPDRLLRHVQVPDQRTQRPAVLIQVDRLIDLSLRRPSAVLPPGPREPRLGSGGCRNRVPVRRPRSPAISASTSTRGQAPLDAAQLPDRRTPRILEPRVTRDLIAWTQRLALDGALAICERETLRYRLLHTASRLAFHAPRDPAPTTHLALSPSTCPEPDVDLITAARPLRHSSRRVPDSTRIGRYRRLYATSTHATAHQNFAANRQLLTLIQRPEQVHRTQEVAGSSPASSISRNPCKR
jgi:hypothetical protein